MTWNRWANENPKKVILLLLGVFAGLLAVVAIAVLLWQHTAHAAFAGHLSEYAGIQPGQQADGGPESVRGKLVVIDKATGKLDPVWDMIPDNMRAANPAAVGTVVWLSWSDSLVGHYEDGGSAYSSDVDVTVIDKATSTVLSTKTFSNQPPATRAAGGSASTVAEKPQDQVVEYLRNLAGVSGPSSVLFLLIAGICLVVAIALLLLAVRVRGRRNRRVSRPM